MTDIRQTTQDADNVQRPAPGDDAERGVRTEDPASETRVSETAASETPAPQSPGTRSADRPDPEQESAGQRDDEDGAATDPLEEEG
jgi:spoIIIJ-associated protein